MIPTVQLPPIQDISSVSCQDLAKALEYIRNLYQPRVRGSRRRRSGSENNKTETFERGHLDPFERNYATKWLGALISHLEFRYFSVSDSETEQLIQSAASLVALCSGTSAAGTSDRDFVFTSNHVSISVHIKDIPLNNQDYSSVGAQTWGGACVLSELIIDDPWKFGLCYPDNADSLHPPHVNDLSTIPSLYPLRILELGAGTGLVSLVTGKLLETLMSKCHASPIDPIPHVVNTSKQGSAAVIIIATDCYLPVLENIDSNIAANIPKNGNSLVSITSHPLDWAHFSATYGSLSATPSLALPAPFDEPFDVVLGADIVYELEHAAWIKSCLSLLLRKPSKQCPSTISSMNHLTDNTFHLVIPLRPTHDKESQTIETVFPYAECFQDEHSVLHGKNRAEGDLSQPALGTTQEQELCILSREVIVCEKDDGEMMINGHSVDDEDGVTYAYYRIGWSSSKRVE